MSVHQITPPGGLKDTVMAGIMRQALRLGLRPFLGAPWSFGMQRFALALGSALMPQDGRAQVRTERLAHMSAERITPKPGRPTSPAVILYLHGGAFVAGSPRTHRSITRRLCALTGAQVLAPDYRLAPEAPFPAQIEDCLLAYEHLLKEGVPAQRIIIAGDSAGGYLTYMTTVALLQKGLPKPAALCLISPVLDTAFTEGGARGSRAERASRDPLIRLSWGETAGHALAIPPGHPWADPMKQDVSAFPPMLVQVGEDEVLFDDSVWLEQAAQRAGRDCELQIHLKRWHVFHAHAGLMPSADQALARMAAFMKQHWQA